MRGGAGATRLVCTFVSRARAIVFSALTFALLG